MFYMKLILFIIFIASLTTLGCVKTITETKIVYVKPEIPESIISSCEPMPSNTSISTNGDLLMSYISLQSLYVICSSKVTSIASILDSYNEIYTNSISVENE